MICENHQCPRMDLWRVLGRRVGEGAEILLEDREGSYLAKRWGKSGGVIDIFVMTAELALGEEQTAP